MCTKVHSTLLDCAQFNNVAAECLYIVHNLLFIIIALLFQLLLLLLWIVVADITFFASLQELVFFRCLSRLSFFSDCIFLEGGGTLNNLFTINNLVFSNLIF